MYGLVQEMSKGPEGGWIRAEQGKGAALSTFALDEAVDNMRVILCKPGAAWLAGIRSIFAQRLRVTRYQASAL
ncbi:hypothetical protein D9M72_576150 [compost metagenome]